MIHPDSRSPWERIHAPESLKNKVLEAAKEARKAAGTAPQNRYVPPPKKRQRAILRPAVAACCAAAVVLGAVTFGNGPQTSPGGGNSFVLAAYAAGTDTDAVPAVKADNAGGAKAFQFDGSWRITDFPNDRAIYLYSFNLHLIGNNIESITYTLEGNEGVGFTYDERLTMPDQNPYEVLPDEEMFSSFTVKPEDDLSCYRIRCVAQLTEEETALLKAEKDGTLYTPEEAERIKKEANENPITIITADDLAYSYKIAETHINEVLNGTIVRVTTTFSDGTQQTKAYQVSAVENFLETVAANYQLYADVDNAYNTLRAYGPDGEVYWKPDPNGMTEEEHHKLWMEADANQKPLYVISELEDEE